MNIPEQFKGRVVKTSLTGMAWNSQLTKMITDEFPGSEIDVIYEAQTKTSRIVIVFETREDSLAYHLKYGGDYV